MAAAMAMADRKTGDLNGQIAEIAECPICAEKFQNNRLLPCGHTFCLKCLEQYKRTAKARGKSLSCPVCRKEFAIPKGGCSAFPKNIIVEKLLEVDNPSKDESNVMLCDTCEVDNKVNAVVHCIECGQNLCGECEKLHGKLKISSTHHVVPVSKNSHFRDFAQRSYCEDHPEYALELMCNDCNRTICWKCRSLNHAQHRVDDLKKLADDLSEQLQSNIEEMNKRLFVLFKIVENIKDQEKQYQDNFEKEKANVSKTAADLIRSVVSNEDKLIKQLLSELQRNLKTLQPHRQQVETQVDRLKQHMASVRQLKESGNSLEILNRTAELHDRATELMSSNIININKLILSSMTESEIQKHLIGSTNIAAANGSADVRRVSSDRSCSGDSGTNFATRLTRSDQDRMGSVQTKVSQLNLTGSVDVRNVSSEGSPLGDSGTNSATCLTSSEKDRMGSVQTKVSQLNLTASSESNTGTYYSNCKTLPQVTPKKHEPKRAASLQSQSKDYINISAASELQAAAEDNDPDSYSHLVPPRPQPPPRPNSLSTPPVSGKNIQRAKAPERQQPAKGVHVMTNIASPAASFSVDGRAAVFGVAVLKQKIYVAVENSPDISVYSCDDHSLVHTLVVPGIEQVSDLGFCRRNNCLYLIDWMVRSIFRVEIEGAKEITHWSTNGEFGGLSVSGDASVLLAGHETNSLKEYTTIGTLIRTVILKSDTSEGIRPWHAVKLASGEYVVSHGSNSDTALHRVCLADSDGQVVKSFGGLRGRGNNGLWGPYHLCMAEENKLFVADCNNSRIVVLNRNLEFLGEIAGTLRKPRRICLDKTSNKLYVTDNKLIAKKATDGRIVVFSQVS